MYCVGGSEKLRKLRRNDVAPSAENDLPIRASKVTLSVVQERHSSSLQLSIRLLLRLHAVGKRVDEDEEVRAVPVREVECLGTKSLGGNDSGVGALTVAEYERVYVSGSIVFGVKNTP